MSAVAEADFAGLRIRYDHRVLRPRAWTAWQSRWAETLLPQLPPGPVLELCCGAGQIGLRAIAGGMRDLVAVDADPVAAEFARHNAVRAGLAERVDVREGRLTEVLAAAERFPMIIADPPWVPSDSTGRFPADPLLAIDGGADGTAVVTECLSVIAGHLAPGGSALLQIGPWPQQAEHVRARSARMGLTFVEVRRYGDRGSVVRLDRAVTRG